MSDQPDTTDSYDERMDLALTELRLYAERRFRFYFEQHQGDIATRASQLCDKHDVDRQDLRKRFLDDATPNR